MFKLSCLGFGHLDPYSTLCIRDTCFEQVLRWKRVLPHWVYKWTNQSQLVPEDDVSLHQFLYLLQLPHTLGRWLLHRQGT